MLVEKQLSDSFCITWAQKCTILSQKCFSDVVSSKPLNLVSYHEHTYRFYHPMLRFFFEKVQGLWKKNVKVKDSQCQFCFCFFLHASCLKIFERHVKTFQNHQIRVDENSMGHKNWTLHLYWEAHWVTYSCYCIQAQPDQSEGCNENEIIFRFYLTATRTTFYSITKHHYMERKEAL